MLMALRDATSLPTLDARKMLIILLFLLLFLSCTEQTLSESEFLHIRTLAIPKPQSIAGIF